MRTHEYAHGAFIHVDIGRESVASEASGITLTLHSSCMKACSIDAYTFVIDLPLRASFPTSSFPFTSAGRLYVSQLATLTRVRGTIGDGYFLSGCVPYVGPLRWLDLLVCLDCFFLARGNCFGAGKSTW